MLKVHHNSQIAPGPGLIDVCFLISNYFLQLITTKHHGDLQSDVMSWSRSRSFTY